MNQKTLRKSDIGQLDQNSTLFISYTVQSDNQGFRQGETRVSGRTEEEIIPKPNGLILASEPILYTGGEGCQIAEVPKGITNHIGITGEQ